MILKSTLRPALHSRSGEVCTVDASIAEQLHLEIWTVFPMNTLYSTDFFRQTPPVEFFEPSSTHTCECSRARGWRGRRESRLPGDLPPISLSDCVHRPLWSDHTHTHQVVSQTTTTTTTTTAPLYRATLVKITSGVVRLERRINETAYIVSSHGPCNTTGSGAVMLPCGGAAARC